MENEQDGQTYYGESWTGETALWQMVVHHGAAPPYEHKHPSTYTDTDRLSHGYRVCCNGLAWIGQALGAPRVDIQLTLSKDGSDNNDL